MDWLRDAHDTLDVVLTYGDVEDPLFRRIVNKYRDMAHDLNRTDDFEQVVQSVLAIRRPHLVRMPLASG